MQTHFRWHLYGAAAAKNKIENKCPSDAELYFISLYRICQIVAAVDESQVACSPAQTHTSTFMVAFHLWI